jgi:hypothetical protein
VLWVHFTRIFHYISTVTEMCHISVIILNGFLFHLILDSSTSLVGIETGYGLDDREVRV